MEEQIYNILCDIREELSDIKFELRSIKGVGIYSKDLYDVCEKLAEIESSCSIR